MLANGVCRMSCADFGLRRPWASLNRSCSRGYLKWFAGSAGFASVMAER